jgi:predicted NBD/HSP70 family sugar kinase
MVSFAKDHVSMGNRMRILNLIKKHGKISRTNLAKITDLSEGAVSRIVQFLIGEGYLMETGFGNSAGGRKPIFIEPNPKAGYIIGVDFEYSKARAAVFDFQGNLQFYYKAIITKDNYFFGLYEAIDACITFVNEKHTILLGIGLGVRGILDSDKGIIVSSKSFSWNNIPLRQIVQDRYRVPVFMDINARLAALGEWALVYRQTVSDFTYITISWGVCAGIIAKGRLFSGANSGAGEIGNTVLYTIGEPKTLEQLCGGQMFLREILNNWEKPCTKMIRDASNGQQEQLTLENVVEAVKQKDPYCLSLAQRAGQIFGIGITNLLVSFNPRIVVLGGQLINMGDVYLEPAKEMVQRLVIPAEYLRVDFKMSKLGDKASMHGASLLVFQNLFPNLYGPEFSSESSEAPVNVIPLTQSAGI